MSKKTIAIIGAAGKTGSALAKSLVKGNYRLLLFSGEEKKLNALDQEIRKKYPSADIDCMKCAADASWEADVIISTISPYEEKEIATKIEPFANRKIVISIYDSLDKKLELIPQAISAIEELQDLFPGAKVAKLFNISFETDFYSPLIDGKQPSAFIGGNDEEAILAAEEIVKMAGVNPAERINHINYYLINKKINTMEMTKWIIDPTHSEIQFKVRHLMVSWVTGHFKKFNATVETGGDDISTAKVRFSADIDSISTNNNQRDSHLKNADFFDSENHPQLIFESEKLEKIDEENYKLHGTLTIRGISKKIVLNVEYGGIALDPWGNTRTGFSVSGKINRRDFGVSFGMISETGGVLLGDDVTINANAEFVKQTVVEKKAA